ncbi:MAG: acyltransferase [Pirellula staleyi]
MNRILCPDTPATITVARPEKTRLIKLAKRCLQALFVVGTLPRLAAMQLMQLAIGEDAFRYASESIGRIPGMRGVLQRQAFYRRTLTMCGQDIYFGWNSLFSMAEAEVGNRAYIGRFCSIGFARIGDEAMLADHVQILSGGQEHARTDVSVSMHQQEQTYRRISIGRGAWIGAGAIVMADVGENAIIGAGAVVSRPIPDNCIAVGVPARVIKRSIACENDVVVTQLKRKATF